MTPNDYERLAFEREKLKDNYELTLRKKKYVDIIKSDYNREMEPLFSVKTESRFTKFLKRLLKVL